MIYLIEQVPGYFAAVQARLTQPAVTLVASDLTRMECRVTPLRNGDTGLLADYDAFFRDTVHPIVPLSAAVMNHATEIRARHGFKTPDSIHLAAAIAAGCDAFYTNDQRLDRFPEMPVEVL